MPLPFLKLNPLLKEPLCSHLIFNLIVFSVAVFKGRKDSKYFFSYNISPKKWPYFWTCDITLEIRTIFFNNIFVETINWFFFEFFRHLILCDSWFRATPFPIAMVFLSLANKNSYLKKYLLQELDEFLGCISVCELSLIRFGWRPNHFPTVRNHQSGLRWVEQSDAKIFTNEKIHGKNSKL